MVIFKKTRQPNSCTKKTSFDIDKYLKYIIYNINDK